MKNGILAASCFMALAISSGASGDSLLDDAYFAVDGATSPGNSLWGGRMEFGVQPNQGWGAALNVAFASGFFTCGCAHYSSTYLGGQPLGLRGVSTYGLFATYTYAANDWLHLTANTGVAHTDYEVSVLTANSGYVLQSSATNIGAGLSMQAVLSDEFELRLQYESMHIPGNITGINRINYLSAGGIFRFR